MEKRTGLEETRLVNQLLDDLVPEFRSALRKVADGSLVPLEAIDALGTAFCTWLESINVNVDSGASYALSYELGLAIRFEVKNGAPYRLDRPRTEMMRTALHECDAEKIPRHSNVVADVVRDSISQLYGSVWSIPEPPEVIAARMIIETIESDRVDEKELEFWE